MFLDIEKMYHTTGRTEPDRAVTNMLLRGKLTGINKKTKKFSRDFFNTIKETIKQVKSLPLMVTSRMESLFGVVLCGGWSNNL